MNLKRTYWLLVGNFLFLLLQMFSPLNDFLRGKIFLLPFFTFFVLGIALFFQAKGVKKGKLRKYLMLTGASSSGVFVGTILHNFFYALGVLTENIFFLPTLFEVLHAGFFLLSIIVCPLGFIIGVVGSIYFFKNK